MHHMLSSFPKQATQTSTIDIKKGLQLQGVTLEQGIKCSHILWRLPAFLLSHGDLEIPLQEAVEATLATLQQCRPWVGLFLHGFLWSITK